ncbi:MBL fold metallo-hydrolase [Photobacterium minamisatsumaniensis]|uniref:MBL fold metallo-hydrolase n=1 Tax=Photobacterium minamisatsumaniensis TaxID=2910233 RepID=UPI003D0E9CB1
MFKHFFILFITLLSLQVSATPTKQFDVVTLGSRGGIQDGNLTAFLVKASQDQHYVTMDAGTLVNGIKIATEKGAFDHITVPEDSPYNTVGYVLKERIKGYFISHAHLDHVAGMIIASPDDSSKVIYSLPSVNSALSSTYFNWVSWPNFTDRGDGFKLKKFQMNDLTPLEWQDIKSTSLKVKTFPLSHSGVESTAFLLDNNGTAFVYFGDTGPDDVEQSKAINTVWKSLVPYIKEDKLSGIVIEVSFTNGVEDQFLFGHLTPDWLMHELRKLEHLAGGKGSLQDLNIIISHIKYSLKKGEDPKTVIKKQLEAQNDLGVTFLFPSQGDSLSL